MSSGKRAALITLSIFLLLSLLLFLAFFPHANLNSINIQLGFNNASIWTTVSPTTWRSSSATGTSADNDTMINTSPTPSPLPPPPPTVSIFIGILTLPDKYLQRHLLRLLYGTQSPSTHNLTATVDIRFVFCNLTKDDQHVLVALEILRFDDIVILNCTENMNNGKTYTYFSSLPSILPRRYDYVMKADDDSYIRLPQLAASLYRLPREELYYGYVIPPCERTNPYAGYMSGMGYALSWDLVEWISTSEVPKRNLLGPEDRMVGTWLWEGKKGKNRYTEKPGMYDYPGTSGKCSHELISETIMVHRLKKMDMWLGVLRYFNVTRRLKQSKMYHLR